MSDHDSWNPLKLGRACALWLDAADAEASKNVVTVWRDGDVSEESSIRARAAMAWASGQAEPAATEAE